MKNRSPALFLSLEGETRSLQPFLSHFFLSNGFIPSVSEDPDTADKQKYVSPVSMDSHFQFSVYAKLQGLDFD